MNPYIFESSCAVCGGPGMATIRAIFGGVHTDPRVCAKYLAEQKRKLDERERRLAEPKER